MKTIDGSDYVSDGPLTLVFNSGNTRQSIPIPLIDDSIFELTETLQASLSVSGGVAPEHVILNPDLADITILDDDSELSLKALSSSTLRCVCTFSCCVWV